MAIVRDIRVSILWRLFAAVMLLVAALLSFGSPSMTFADTGTTVPGALWTVPMSMQGSPVATPTGRVLALACTITSQVATDLLVQSVTPDGSVAWSVPANIDHTTWGCPTAVGDTQGNTYLQTIDTHGNPVLESVDALGGLRWTTPLGTFSTWGGNPVLGANGSVYLVERDSYGSPHLFGYDANTGVVTLNNVPFPYVTGLYAYSGGLAVVNTNAGGIFGLDSEVDYLSYDGTVLHRYDTGVPISYNGNFSNAGGADGSVFVAGYPPTCSGGGGYGSQGLTNLSIEKITPAGLAWTWTDSNAHNCSSTKLAATPDGGVILARNEDVPNPAADFTSISSTGALRWTHHASGPLGRAYNGGGFVPVTDSNGVVALPSSYDFTCPNISTVPCSGVQVEFVTQDAASSLLPTLQVTDPASQYFNLYDLAIDAGRVYLARTDTPVDNGGSLSAFAVPGLATDYRLALQETLTDGKSGSSGGGTPSGSGVTSGGSSSSGGGGHTTAPPTNPCVSVHGSIGKRLLASLKCTAHLTKLEAECGFGITKLIFLPLKSLKLVEAAKGSSIIDKLPAKSRPVAKFLYDLAHAKYSKRAPRGFRNGAETVKTIFKIHDAYHLIRVLPNLAKAISKADFSQIALDLDDIAGLRSCVQAVADGLAG